MRLWFASKEPLIRKKRLRGSPFVASPIFTLTLNRITPRRFAGGAVWVWPPAITARHASSPRPSARRVICFEMVCFIRRVSRRYLCWLEIRAAWEFHKRQAHTSDKYLIRTNCRRGRVPVGSAGCDQIVLIYPIATNTNRSNQDTVLVKWNAAGKDLNSIWQTRN